ncbi:MAG: Peptidase family, partial [Blastocatellia bacterium]|nr:Peptidase family [Blastocatellia bacterium]
MKSGRQSQSAIAMQSRHGLGRLRKSVAELMTAALLAMMLPNYLPVKAFARNDGRTTASRNVDPRSQSNRNKVPSTIKKADAVLLAQVSQRILAVARTHPANIEWPPSITLADEQDLNAYARLRVTILGNGKWKERVDRAGKFIPYVVVDQLMMDEVIQGNADRLAMLIGHELSHVILGHIFPTSIVRTAKTGTLKVVFTSEQEHDADINGVKLALAAGYSYKGARDIWEEFKSSTFTAKYPDSDYSSFESAGQDHPSWTDRLSYIDKEKANIWKAMSAFENGCTFLGIQQYPAAEESFSRVVQEFPDSYEGWANLGYARLMMYLDAFDAGDLKRYDIGQLVVGSFYFRPEELRARTRGVNAKQWQQAVDALKKALELKPDLSLAKANLGVAY